MIMKLPNKFNIRGVEVKDSILKIYKRDRFIRILCTFAPE